MKQDKDPFDGYAPNWVDASGQKWTHIDKISYTKSFPSPPTTTNPDGGAAGLTGFPMPKKRKATSPKRKEINPKEMVWGMIDWAEQQQTYYWLNNLSGETDLREFFQRFCLCDICVPASHNTTEESYQDALVNLTGVVLDVGSTLPKTKDPLIGYSSMAILPKSLHNKNKNKWDFEKRQTLMSVDSFLVRADVMRHHQKTKDPLKIQTFFEDMFNMSVDPDMMIPNLVIVSGLKTMYGKNMSSEYLTLMYEMLYYMSRMHTKNHNPFVVVTLN